MICPTCFGCGWRLNGRAPNGDIYREPRPECGGSGVVSCCDEAGAGIADGGKSLRGVRWTPRLKEETVAAFDAGELTQSDLDRLLISPEELAHWRELIAIDGRHALRVTKTKLYRNPLDARHETVMI